MLKAIQYDEIKNKKRYFPLDVNSASKLYIEKNIIYKIPYHPSTELKQMLEYIEQLNSTEFIKVLNLIYNKDKLVGYSFIRYINYKSLNKHKLRNFELKKEDCYKILKFYNTIAKKQIECIDLHKGNILLNHYTNSIKACDLDAYCFSDNKDLKKIQLKQALILSIAYLYNLKEYDVKNIFNSDGIFPNSFINSCLDSLDELDINIAIKLIESLQYPYVLQERNEIKVKSKELSKLGYSKFNRF